MRTITRMSSISLSTIALGLAACQGAPASLENVGEARLAAGAMNPNTILIFDTAGDGAVYEAARVVGAGYIPEVVDAAGWQAKAPGEFATYKALIIGDMNCSGTDPAQLLVAEQTNTIWTPEVTGNVIVVGTDPESHFTGSALAREAVQFAAAGAGTGAYISLGCYYSQAAAATPVPVLSGFGSFTVFAEPQNSGRTDGHQVAIDPTMVLLDDADLQWTPESAREIFETFPATFQPHVILEDPFAPNALSFLDLSVGVPYVVSRGAMPNLCGNNQINAGEQCDDGNYVSGDGCTEDCFFDTIACGDWSVDQGEQCDDGNTTDGDGCSATCQWEIQPSIGACCLSGGGCAEALSPAACEGGDGVYTADSLTCAQVANECGNFTGACCLPQGGCADAMTPATCQAKGGAFLGEYANCADDGWQCKASEPTGACCVGNGCAAMTQSECQAANGSYAGAGSICDEATCPGCTTSDPIGACCVEGQCLVLTADACFLNDGLYAGDGSVCTSGVCDCGGPTGCCDEIAAGCSMTAGDTQKSGSIFASLLAALSATFFARRRRSLKDAAR